MTRDTNSTDPRPQLPAAVIALGRALRPTLAKVSATLRRSPPAGGEVATIASVERRLSRLANACGDVVAKVQELGRALATGGEELAIHRAVGAFEAHLQVVQDGYAEVLAWGGTKRARRGRDLLAAVYRNILTQIKDWIEEIVETVDDPLVALERRGLPTKGDVNLTIALTLRPPPELEQLMRWAKKNATSEGGGMGFWSIVAGTVLGIGIALLFLEDE